MGDVRPTDKDTYWKLHHIKDTYPSCNVYGVITRVEKIDNSYDSKGQYQDQFRLKLISKPGMEPVDVTIYAAFNSLPGDVFIIGNVVRIHRIRVLRFNRKPGLYLSGRLKQPVSVVVFEFNDQLEKTIIYKSHIDAAFTELDDNTIEYLKPAIMFVKGITPSGDSFDQEVVNDDDYAPSISNEEQSVDSANENRRVVVSTQTTPAQQSIIPQRRISRPVDQNPPDTVVHSEPEVVDRPLYSNIARHRSLDSIEIFDEVKRRIGRFMHIHQYTRYCNVACEVVSAYCGNKEFNILRVWDGSRAPCRIKTNTRETLILNGFEPAFGDQKLEAQIEADNMLYDIICWEKHGVDAVQLRTGDWVVLTNLNYVINRDALALHAGWGAERYLTGIEKLKPGHPVYDILKNQMQDAKKELRDVQIHQDVNVEHNPEPVVDEIPLGFDRPLAIRPNEGSDEEVQISPNRSNNRPPVTEPTSAPARIAVSRTTSNLNVAQKSPQITPRRNPRRNISQSVPCTPSKNPQSPRKSPRTPVVMFASSRMEPGTSSRSNRGDLRNGCPATEPVGGKKRFNRSRRRNLSTSDVDEQTRTLRMTGERLKRLLESPNKNDKHRTRRLTSDATQLMEAEIEDSQPRKKRKSQFCK